MKDTPVRRAKDSTRGLKREQDAYGQAMLDFHEGRRGFNPIIERDDGMIDVDFGVHHYFEQRFSAPDREALRLARGRILDVGAGAGRVALDLQKRGHEVVAIDNSPLAVGVMKSRGVKDARVLPFKQIDQRFGAFDALVMWGNNFGLFGRRAGAVAMLKRLRRLTTSGARIIAQTVNIYETDEPVHLAYHRFNRRRGRMPGELRIRVRYKKQCGPWFDYMMVSPEEMADIADGTGWFLERVISYPDAPFYFGVIERED
jgi:SAM-dependent methyltransferase